MTSLSPDPAALAAAFGLGDPTSEVEPAQQGWGGHNVVWRLTTTQGTWAIKEVGRDPGVDPDGALAIELAAYAGGVPMPRPVRSATGRCFAMLEGRRFRCHAWVEGTALPWHGHAPETAACVGGVLAAIHRLKLQWPPTLALPDRDEAVPRWLALAVRVRHAELRDAIEQALPSISALQPTISRAEPAEAMIGSHRDLHPTNLMRLRDGGLLLVDWDAAGPVVPRQEVACFALVYAKRDDSGSGYDAAMAREFVDGYRGAGGDFRFNGPGDLAMQVQGRLWWTEQNVRYALSSASTSQLELTLALVRGLSGLRSELEEMCAVLAEASEA